MPELYEHTTLIVLAVALAVAVWMAVSQWRRARDLEKLQKDATKSWQESVEQTQEAARLAGEQKTRADGYYNVIEQIGIERDRWNKEYHAASSGHRTAQQMLMNELTRLSKILSRGAQICTDKPGKAHQSLPASKIEMLRVLCSKHVDPKIATIVQEYAEQHGDDGVAADIPLAPRGLPQEGAQPAV